MTTSVKGRSGPEQVKSAGCEKNNTGFWQSYAEVILKGEREICGYVFFYFFLFTNSIYPFLENILKTRSDSITVASRTKSEQKENYFQSFIC